MHTALHLGITLYILIHTALHLGITLYILMHTALHLGITLYILMHIALHLGVTLLYKLDSNARHYTAFGHNTACAELCFPLTMGALSTVMKFIVIL